MVKKGIIKKKTYNPLKMFGSYVGVLYVLINTFFKRGALFNLDYYSLPIMILGILLSLIIGFVFGWGIHSLFRFLKK